MGQVSGSARTIVDGSDTPWAGDQITSGSAELGVVDHGHV